MTWMTTFYLRAFVILLQIALIFSDGNGPMPGFKQQPKDIIIETLNQSILCKAKGEPPLKIFWFKDEQYLDITKLKGFSISSGGSLNIFNTNPERDEGDYRCVVENKFGTVFSRKAKVTFPYMNEFADDDKKVIVQEGDPAVLFCRPPDSYPDHTIHWSKGPTSRSEPLQYTNKNYKRSLSGDLYFSYTTLQDTGIYWCTVENNILQKYLKRQVILRVIKKTPQKNASPLVRLFDNQIAMKDSNFMLECIATGRPIPDMTFTFVKTGDELKGAKQFGNRLRYEFGRFGARHVGEYSCDLKNSYKETSERTAFIGMEAKPEFVDIKTYIPAAVDSTAVLLCAATGIPSVTYSWFYNGNSLPGNSEVTISNGNITIGKVMKHHEGFYQCLASNRHGEALLTIRLAVVEILAGFGQHSLPPAAHTYAVVGGKTEIHCRPIGAPKPTVTWRKNNNTYDITSSDRRFTVLSTGILIIKNIKKSDEGSYECIAHNRLGTARASGNLVVTDGLAIIGELRKENTVQIDTRLVLTCRLSPFVTMEVSFRWFRGKTKLRNNKRLKIIKFSNRQSQLIIEKVQERDAGKYKCAAIGTRNQVTKSKSIYTTGPPSTPTDVEATEQNGVNVKVSWTMGRRNKSPMKCIYIQARTTFDLDSWHTIKISNKTEGNRLYEIVHLSPWVQYRIRVIAENEIGKSKPSKEFDKWIRTPTAKPTKNPTNITGTGAAPSELTISFTPLSEMDQNAPGIRYIVYHKEKGSSYDMIQDPVPKGENHITLTFRNENFYKEYQFQVQAKNDVGYGPKSPVYVAYTGERRPIGRPTNLRVTLVTATSAVATWDEVKKTREHMRGQFLGYKLLYWVRQKEGRPIVQHFVTSYKNKAKVHLTPFTEYYFQVLAYNNAGDGAESNIVGPLRTAQSKPSKPANLKIIEASGGQIKLNWDEPLSKNGILRKYLFSYQSLPNGKINRKTIDTDNRVIELNNLSQKDTYQFTVAAVTGAGIGEQQIITFNFSQVPSEKLETLRIDSVGHTAVVLMWSPVIDSPDVTGYKVFYWTNDIPKTKVIALWERRDDIITTVRNLLPDTTYSFQISVVNRYGAGPRSNTIKAHTKSKYDPSHPDPNRSNNTFPKGNDSNKLNMNNYIILILILIAVLVPR